MTGNIQYVESPYTAPHEKNTIQDLPSIIAPETHTRFFTIRSPLRVGLAFIAAEGSRTAIVAKGMMFAYARSYAYVCGALVSFVRGGGCLSKNQNAQLFIGHPRGTANSLKHPPHCTRRDSPALSVQRHNHPSRDATTMAGHQGWVAHPTKDRTVRRPFSCERATGAVPLVRVSDTSKRGLLPATATTTSAAVTCNSSRRVRPRPQGTSRSRTGKAAATAMVLCNLFGGSSSFRVGATPPTFLSATAGIESGGALIADAARRRSGAAFGCAPNKSFAITTTSRRSVTSSSAESGTAVRASSSRRRCRQRLHRDRSAVFFMRLLVDDNNNEEGTSPRQEEESYSPALPQRSAGALGPAARGATSRLELLRQTSAAIALVGAATAGLLLPTRRVGASTTDLSRTPVAKMAAAASERMVWVNEDSGTVSSRLSQADETYGQGFVAYLARFLLNYDEGCREYFKGKLDCTLPKRDDSHVWEEFRVRPYFSSFVVVFGVFYLPYILDAERSRTAQPRCSRRPPPVTIAVVDHRLHAAPFQSPNANTRLAPSLCHRALSPR